MGDSRSSGFLGCSTPDYRTLARATGKPQLEADGQSELSTDGGGGQDDTLWLPPGLAPVGDDGNWSAAGADSSRSLSAEPEDTVRVVDLPTLSGDGSGAFLWGYYDGAGRPEWAEHFLRVLACEGSQWEGYHGQNSYWSRAQFSLDTWVKVMRHFQPADERAFADDPYSVGLAVAWWSSLTVPSEQWPTCWWG